MEDAWKGITEEAKDAKARAKDMIKEKENELEHTEQKMKKLAQSLEDDVKETMRKSDS